MHTCYVVRVPWRNTKVNDNSITPDFNGFSSNAMSLKGTISYSRETLLIKWLAWWVIHLLLFSKSVSAEMTGKAQVGLESLWVKAILMIITHCSLGSFTHFLPSLHPSIPVRRGRYAKWWPVQARRQMKLCHPWYLASFKFLLDLFISVCVRLYHYWSFN